MAAGVLFLRRSSASAKRWREPMPQAATNQLPDSAANRESPFSRRMFQVLFQLAHQYRRQFLIVTLFSFLYSGLDLIQPLIYRVAINDVAGLFVTPSGPLAGA